MITPAQISQAKEIYRGTKKSILSGTLDACKVLEKTPSPGSFFGTTALSGVLRRDGRSPLQLTNTLNLLQSQFESLLSSGSRRDVCEHADLREQTAPLQRQKGADLNGDQVREGNCSKIQRGARRSGTERRWTSACRQRRPRRLRGSGICF